MNKIQELVREFDDASLRQLVDEYEQYEGDCQIGDCALRREAEKAGKMLGYGDSHVVMWMERIAFESYRELFRRSEM